MYASLYGGALKTFLSYAANSLYVTYLDDDNWYAPEHLSTMLAAIAGKTHQIDRLYIARQQDSPGSAGGAHQAQYGDWYDRMLVPTWSDDFTRFVDCTAAEMARAVTRDDLRKPPRSDPGAQVRQPRNEILNALACRVGSFAGRSMTSAASVCWNRNACATPSRRTLFTSPRSRPPARPSDLIVTASDGSPKVMA